MGATGWLFHLDAPNLLMTSLRPAPGGVTARLLECAGHGGPAELRCVRDPKSAVALDARDNVLWLVATSKVAATFDVIVLSGSVARIPQGLLGSLKPGGRLAAVVGDEPMMRAHFVTRVGEGKWETIQPWDTVAPRLLNFPAPSRFNF